MPEPRLGDSCTCSDQALRVQTLDKFSVFLNIFELDHPRHATQPHATVATPAIPVGAHDLNPF